MFTHLKHGIFITLLLLFFYADLFAQSKDIQWAKNGNTYITIDNNELVEYTLPDQSKKVIISKDQLTPKGQSTPLHIDLFTFSEDNTSLLIYTNTKKVWRINTRGDYWVLNRTNNNLKKVGETLPEASLMFAKFSPDGRTIAYVSNYNLYVEDLHTNTIKQLTTDGTRKFINGTFDWVYEEEFACRDGFRWSPDSKSIAFWQIDARDTKDFFLINNTEDIYSTVIPVEYPKVGQDPSACRIGVVDITNTKTTWMNVPGDPRQHYIVRMEFIPGKNEILIQQLNRKQNESKLMVCHAPTGNVSTIFTEKDEAWIDIYTPSGAENSYDVDYKHPIHWLAAGKDFLWTSEKDNWRHLYRISTDGKQITPVTKGAFDVIALKHIDEKQGYVYFLASPDNATQKYLYRTKLSGKSSLELITKDGLKGTHNYKISSDGKFALHSFSNITTKPIHEVIDLTRHVALNEKQSIKARLPKVIELSTVEFFKVTTVDGVTMDGWMVKPINFDPAKKYPVVFYVYTEPWSQTVTDSYGAAHNFLYAGNMRQDGYIYISLDNRGTPAPKGASWRKAIHRKIGVVNIRDQAMAATEILKWNYVDPQRIAVWGWSGGATTTLNLLFQYPAIYKTGIAIAAVADMLTYDNIYQERYMGLPQENMEDYRKGAAITYAKNLQGNLLYIHGTGDDNVHYQNAEMLIDELIKHNKQFQFMAYPNRTHSMAEGEGTFEHLVTLYTQFLQKNCPPGAR